VLPLHTARFLSAFQADHTIFSRLKSKRLSIDFFTLLCLREIWRKLEVGSLKLGGVHKDSFPNEDTLLSLDKLGKT
jgi:hypothetical protein